jgi:hypothetical protein
MKLKIYRSTVLFLLVLATCLAGFAAYSAYRKDRLAYLEGKNILYKSGEVLGVNSDEIEESIDYSKQLHTASPLLFGGAHAPELSHQKAWDDIQAVGVTAVRKDFYLDRFLPQNISLEQYRQNVGGVQDPANWNQTEINKVRDVYKNAHRRGMKTMGILAYNIRWLSYSNTHYGVPKDWSVYEDIAKKSYKLYRDDIDYLEVWNEPDLDFFLDTKNSPINDEEAYYQITKHAVKAIREVDAEINDGKRMQIGVGVISRPENTRMLEKILADKSLTSSVDFISYHNYEWLKEPSDLPLEKILQKHNVSLPIFLTEWSHTPNIKQSDAYVLTDQAISYAGSKLVDYMNMGLAGANYFSLQPIMPNSKRGDEGMLGYYTVNGSTTNLLPISKTWTLMSQTLGLGKGDSKVFSKTSDQKVAPLQNSAGKYGLVVANETALPQSYNFTVYNLPSGEEVVLTAYVASRDSDGKKKMSSVVLENKQTGLTFKAVIPPNAVVGIVADTPSWSDKLPF